ncbi:hypothetical protein [Geodermatophilus normandii]|uniref:Uncharacterized protein n=1 Tax=Geodermatophilus normandii TaxID=1137989 RepID=A0A6P0GHZ9_9ACTN|nr:hypothetical protein [Geodermatophilus normandii]NEM06945.1 hypothetical protein [Geodermatophilus normandii]
MSDVGTTSSARRRLRVPLAAARTAVAGVATLGFLAVAGSAQADSWYGRPNTMTCVYTTVAIDAPTNVPVSGPVLWRADVQSFDPVAGTWATAISFDHTNQATAEGITPGPWTDTASGDPYVYVVSAGMDPGDPTAHEIRVVDSFFDYTAGQWVEGFLSQNTLTGGETCTITGGGISV